MNQEGLFNSAVAQAGNRLDVNGWRRSQAVGEYKFTPLVYNATEFKAACDYLTAVGNGGRTKGYSSYHLKHQAEYRVKSYVSNGTMLAAAIAMGFAPTPLWTDGNLNQQVVISRAGYDREYRSSSR